MLCKNKIFIGVYGLLLAAKKNKSYGVLVLLSWIFKENLVPCNALPILRKAAEGREGAKWNVQARLVQDAKRIRTFVNSVLNPLGKAKTLSNLKN